MKKKIMAIVLCIALLAIAVGGSTLAFLTDTDEQINTFTVGDVSIDLLESQLHRQNDNASDDQIIADDKIYMEEYLAVKGKDMVPGRWVKKAPYVLNDGTNAAYVRIKMTVEQRVWENLDMMLYTTGFNANAMVRDNGVDNGDGTVTYTFTYTEALQPGKVTYYVPFWQFKIKDALDNADLIELRSEDIQNWIKVTAEAIQAEGFADYVEAFAAFDAQQNSN